MLKTEKTSEGTLPKMIRCRSMNWEAAASWGVGLRQAEESVFAKKYLVMMKREQLSQLRDWQRHPE
jgi:hypothetical protein